MLPAAVPSVSMMSTPLLLSTIPVPLNSGIVTPNPLRLSAPPVPTTTFAAGEMAVLLPTCNVPLLMTVSPM